MGNEIDSAVMTTEARTIRKVRIRIIPFIFLLYIVAFLDRINITFAALTMNRDLAISSQQYGLLSGIFFIGYFLFEIVVLSEPIRLAGLEEVLGWNRGCASMKLRHVILLFPILLIVLCPMMVEGFAATSIYSCNTHGCRR
jgi:hypothetical protein